MSERFDHYAEFHSEFVRPRRVDVWLPAQYDQASQRRFPVLYMHDGQNLFDPATSYGGIPWAIDTAMNRLVAEGQVEPVIVVGIWNTDQRRQEYCPQKPFALKPEFTRSVWWDGSDPGEALADSYLRFFGDRIEAICGCHLPHTPGTRPYLHDGFEHGWIGLPLCPV